MKCASNKPRLTLEFQANLDLKGLPLSASFTAIDYARAMTRTVRDPLAATNERVKLFAGFINALGIGLIGFAVLRPVDRKPLQREHVDDVVDDRRTRIARRLALYPEPDPEGGEGMTFFEFIVPVIALAVAGIGYLILRAQVRKLDEGRDD
jgi:hypothetical protein